MQNLISKYLIYALGEIILVVIGILIALQINTWNQKRLLQKEETQYLKQIIGDLELDLQTLRSVQYNYELKLVLGKEVLETLGSDNVKNLQKRPGFERALAQKARYEAELREPFGQKLFLILVISRFSQTQNAYQEMLDTGKIAIIQDDSLKLALQKQYKLLLTTISFQEEIVMAIQHSYRESLVINGISTLNQDPFDEIQKGLVNKKHLVIELENYLRITQVMLNSAVYDDNSITNSTKQLIARIQKYLDRKKAGASL